MTRGLSALALVALLGASLPAVAQQVLPPAQVDGAGALKFRGGPTLGRWQSNKYVATPDTIEILGSGSLGNVSGMSVTASTTAGAGTLARLAANVVIVSDGTTATPGAQAAIDTAATLKGSVEIRGAVQALSTPLAMRPGVTVRCTQGGGVSKTGTVVEFNTYLSSGSVLDGCIVDGGWDGTSTTDGSLGVLNYGGASDAKLTNNIFRNMRGVGVYQNGTLRFIIDGNTFSNIGTIGVAVNNDGAPFEHYGAILRNRFINPNQHAVLTVKGSRIRVEGNDIVDATVCGMSVNLSGAPATKTITSTGSPDFTNVRVGSFLVTSGGLEYLVNTKASATSLTASLTSGSDPGTVTGATACAGDGDHINMQSGVGNRIINNTATGGATTCYLAWDDGTNPSIGAEIYGNRCENPGNAGVVVDGSGGKTRGTSVRLNTVLNPGQNRAGSGAGFNAGVVVYAGALNTAVNDNTLIDTQTTPSMEYGVSLTSGVPVGSTIVGRNSVSGAINEGVRNGVSSITIPSGWGSGATVSNIVYREGAITFTIASAGTGQAAGPAINIFQTALPGGQSPVMSLVMQDSQVSPFTRSATIPELTPRITAS